MISTFDPAIGHKIGMQAIPYHRFSDSKQERGSSLERQREITAAAILQNGWTALPPIEDRGFSAWHGTHLDAGLGSISANAQAGMYAQGTIIVAETIDRLSRLGHDSFRDWLKSIIRAGLRVYTCDDRKLYDGSTIDGDDLGSKITQMVKAEGARDVITRMRGRVIEGIRSNQTKRLLTGKPDSHVHPKWLAYDDAGDLHPIPERAEAIRMIFDLSVDHGALTIAKIMNDGPYRPWTAKTWKPTTIRHLLDHPSVDGSFQQMEFHQPFGDRLEAFYPAIVDNDLIARSRAARKRRERMRTGGKPSRDFINLFQGLTFCEGCRGRMHVQKCEEKKKDGTKIVRRFFRCYNAAHKAGCDRRTMFRYGDFETGILDHLLHLALDDRFFARPDDTRELAIRVADLERTLDGEKTKSANLLNLMISGTPDPIMIQMRDKLTASIAVNEKALEAAREALADARGTIDPAEHMKRVLEVRAAMDDADPTVVASARTKIATAIRGVVSQIDFDATDTTISVVIAGGIAALRFDNRGQMIEQFDHMADQRVVRATVGSDPIWQANLDAMLRRVA